jgi:tetratricopeptide (TPR) repeat protein
MAVDSAYNFLGGYEHDTKAGVLIVADHHISPGKKQWTWGNSDFGQAWDRNLTDEDGPYIELMTGVYTDNQPDFSWIMPYEEKAFSQYFFPYREVGLVKNASKDIVVGLENNGDKTLIRIFVTSQQARLNIVLTCNNLVLLNDIADLSPEGVYTKEVSSPGIDANALVLVINGQGGRELIRYESAINEKKEIPSAAKPVLKPRDIPLIEELFLAGQHLEQYRHAIYSPAPYYQEALKRSPGDTRSNNALGLWYLRRGQFAKSEPYFRKAVATSVQRNPNPYDGEPYYNLGFHYGTREM